MSNIRQGERGSAMMITIVVVIILVGLSAAMLSENLFRNRTRAANQTSDEAQLICDAGLEYGRKALLEYRNANKMVWNDIFVWSKENEDGIPDATGGEPLDTVTEADAYDSLGNPILTEILNWKLTNVDRIKKEYLGTTLSYNQVTDNSTSILPDYKQVFCKIIAYGRGAFHLVLFDDDDLHGDGIDNDLDGDLYDIDNDTADGEVDEATLGNADATIDGDGEAFLVVTAILPDGTTRQNVVKVWYDAEPPTIGEAVRTNGSLVANGAFKILGSKGTIHANENITGNGGGQAQVSVAVNASGSTSGFSMNNAPPGGINSGVPPVSIPAMDIPYFKSSDFALKDNVVILKSDGTISAGSGVPGNSFPFSSSVNSSGTRTWTIQGNNAAPTPAIYYVEGNFKMTGQGNGAPYEMSLVAEGSIWLGGNSAFKPYQYNGESVGMLAVAGTDVLLTGNGVSGVAYQFEGIVVANEQAKAQGNYVMNGSLTGVNLTDSPNSIVSNTSGIDLTITGTPTIVYNGMDAPFPNTAKSVVVQQIIRTK